MNKFDFTAKSFPVGFHLATAEVAADLGLVPNSNDRQRKNGTLSFHDPVVDCSYTLHPNGYIRRYIMGYFGKTGYQLNKKITKVMNNGEFDYTETTRIPATPEEQLQILQSAVTSYRKR